MFNRFKSALNQQGYESIIDISFDTFNVFRTKTKSIMSYQESKSLYDEAVKQSKSLKTKQLKVLRRAAPQLQTAMAAVKASRELITPDYENLFGRRADQYAPEGSVSSRFSPTAYLAELYREAKELHGEGMPEHIDVRRPDIGSLVLSQAAQDETLSTLSMANEVIKASIGEADIEKKLSVLPEDSKLIGGPDTEKVLPKGLPFHLPFERIQSAMAQKGIEFSHIATFFEYDRQPASRLKFNSLLCLELDICPSLYDKLKDTDENQLNLWVQVTELSSFYIEQILDLWGNSLTSNLSYALYDVSFIKKLAAQGWAYEDALVLLGYGISNKKNGSKVSQFDRLFNTNLLEGRTFTVDNSRGSMNYNPESNEFIYERNVLKRAFEVDDQELFDISEWLFHPDTRSLHNISAAYQLTLLVKLLGSSVSELKDFMYGPIDLLGAFPFSTLNSKAKLGDSVVGFYRVFGMIIDRFNWLIETNLDYSTVSLMLGESTPKSESPQMIQLWKEIDLQANHHSNSGIEEVIASSFLLTNSTVASLVLNWAESTSNYTTKQYIDNINRYLNSQESELKKIIDFTARIAQLSIIVNHFQLTSAELELFKQEHLEWQTLMDISYIKQGTLVLNTSNASTYLSLQPQENKLSVENMIDLLCEDYSEENIQSAYANISGLSGGEHFYRCIKLLEFSKSKKLPVEVFAALASKDKEPSSYTYEDWSAIAHKCEAALSHYQLSKYKNKVEESLSQALCGYFLTNKAEAVTSFDLNDREALYRYLLIDNKVSGEILTTRVAESIASLQLYVNKCIQGFEPNIDHELLLRPFFEHWSRYNNRYSTWAGLEKLTFYPENYVEPTLRYNQTRLQQGLLSDISQNQLNDETVDNAYRRYLNQFEEVANLDVLSGYLHGNDFHLGDTYFAARSKAKPHRYYWRSLDNTASDGLDGYVASAWSEWEEITTPMTPLRDQVRLVMFQDRLYMSWIEAVESAEKDSSGDKIEPKTSYLLKLSYRKIDGTWAAALEYPLNMPSSLTSTFNLYSTYHSETESMLFMLYNPNKVPGWYDGIGSEGPAYGGVIGADLQFKEKAASDEGWKDIYTNFKNNLNTSTVKNKVIRYVPDAYYEYESPLKLLSPSTNKDGIVSNVKIDEHYIDNDDIPPKFVCKTSFNVKAAYSLSPKESNRDTPSNLKVTGFSGVKVFSNRVELDLHQSEASTAIYFKPKNGTSGYKGGEQGAWNNGKIRYKFMCKIPEGATSYTLLLDVYKKKPKPARNYYKQSFEITIQSSIGVNHWGLSPWKALPLYPSTQKLNHTFFYNLSGGTLKTTPVLKVNKSGTTLYQQNLHIDLGTSANVNPTDNMLIVNDLNGACYLEFTNKARRTRLNTLFAKELISRARYGLDNVLSWETQQLAEPKLGKGNYIDVTFPAYDPKQHGSGQFTVHTVGVNYFRSQAQALSGQLTEGAPTTVKVFLPYSEHRDSSGESGQAFIGVTFDGSDLGGSHSWGEMDRYGWDAAKSSYKITESESHLEGASSQISELQTEPMDFSGANSLYFWELFYYTPMMVADRLLQSQAFESAERWLKYVFNPSGYYEKSLEGLEDTGRQWNMRPLQEDTAWDDDNIETTDPDIVAQADPMHYKVATYMKLLDLLIARGDMAYRRLERDTLNEAKMWYSVAKNLLGEQSASASTCEWSELALNVVADKEVQKSALKTMDLIAAGQASQATYDAQVKMLFYPTSNDKLTGYEQTLNQRLFNLRHNLSIDGQPLTLPIYAEPADPKALHRAAAASVDGGYAEMGQASIAIQRFPVMLESARGLVNQLTHYGSTLLSVLEKKDAEGLSQLMQTHAVEVMDSTLDQQALMIDELKSEQALLAVNLRRANASLETYQAWLKEGVSHAEKKAIDTRFGAGELALSANVFRVAGAAIDATPNVFGFAFGGMQLGSLLHATAAGFDASSAWAIAQAEVLETSEQYRRRAQQWESARDDAKLAVKEIEQQQKTLAIRLEAAEMQASLLKTQKSQLNEQLDLLKTKFTNQSLYSWMQGKLATLYYQFYDLVVMRCLKAQLGYQWETRDTSTFIQPGAWDSHRAGLLCGEALMLNLTQMESAYLDWDSRSLEVNRTVSMCKEMGDAVDFNAEVLGAMKGSDPSVSSSHSLQMKGKEVFEAKIDLKALDIEADYPDAVVGDNKVRRIKQVSVSLPALLGPYQDVQAVLSYSGNGDLIHQSCTQAAISHGVNDSGQFQLDFNDCRYLPFEGLPIDGDGSASLILTFPNAGDSGKQRALLESLTDIILHIRYTIGTSK